ncbi:hypothetical protein Tco_0946350 [Tanacetum coccineum]
MMLDYWMMNLLVRVFDMYWEKVDVNVAASSRNSLLCVIRLDPVTVAAVCLDVSGTRVFPGRAFYEGMSMCTSVGGEDYVVLPLSLGQEWGML